MTGHDMSGHMHTMPTEGVHGDVKAGGEGQSHVGHDMEVESCGMAGHGHMDYDALSHDMATEKENENGNVTPEQNHETEATSGHEQEHHQAQVQKSTMVKDVNKE